MSQIQQNEQTPAAACHVDSVNNNNCDSLGKSTIDTFGNDFRKQRTHNDSGEFCNQEMSAVAAAATISKTGSRNNDDEHDEDEEEGEVEEFDFSDSDLSDSNDNETMGTGQNSNDKNIGVEEEGRANLMLQLRNTDNCDLAVHKEESGEDKGHHHHHLFEESENLFEEEQINKLRSTEEESKELDNNCATEAINDAVNGQQNTISVLNDGAEGGGDGEGDGRCADNGNSDDEYCSNEEDEFIVNFLGTANHIAEARLAARRQARAEAREIRMRELERQQKEQEQNADRVFDMQTAAGIDPLSRSRLTLSANSIRGNSMSSRRSSEDSLEEEGRSLRDIRHELKDVEERFRKAMIANAQLDNERASQSYQIQLLKDKLEEMEESFAQLQREYKDKCRDHNALKRNLDKLEEELKLVRGQLDERDTLITEQGLVIVLVENEDGSDAKRALVTMENAQLLGSVQGSLDVRLKRFTEEKQQLQKEVQNLQQQLNDIKTQGRRGSSMNGPLGADDDYDAQREANKIIADYKYKLQKAEQEIASLQASLARSETQVIRYKSTAEAAEKAEAELKIERRKLQRENREAMERLEELETTNNHLLKRLDKLKNAKSALLKDL